MKYIIDEKIANAILDYLVRRPYIEVANLISSIHLLKPYDDNAKQASPIPADVKKD